MEATRFDLQTRAIASQLTRRNLASLLGLAGTIFPALADAKKTRKKRKKRKHKRKNIENKEVIFNEFGCVDVSGYCEHAGQCCSGICEDDQDQKTCRAHDVSTCQTDQDACDGDMTPCTTSTGVVTGECVRTTGKASYCHGGAGGCIDCARDTDCVPICGPQAACIVCPLCASERTQTACVGPAGPSG